VHRARRLYEYFRSARASARRLISSSACGAEFGRMKREAT
jgi:hypothetical protein